jgi:hypothetical protein
MLRFGDAQKILADKSDARRQLAAELAGTTRMNDSGLSHSMAMFDNSP